MPLTFRDLPVYDLAGVTRDLEYLIGLKLKGSVEGTLDEPILKKESVTSPKLAKISYTEIAKERASKTEFEPSATRTATVIWQNGAGLTTAIKVNKVSILPSTIPTSAPISFKVPFGQKWEWEGEGAGHSTYILE